MLRAGAAGGAALGAAGLAYNSLIERALARAPVCGAVERALGRVQNYVGELADAGAKLVGLPAPPMESGGSQAHQAFEALRDAGVIGRGLCKKLVRAQAARTRIEHSYVQTPAGDVHRAATLIRDAARDFMGSYRTWIEPYLVEAEV